MSDVFEADDGLLQLMERERRKAFRSEDAAEDFRGPLAFLNQRWAIFNHVFADKKLVPPCMGIGDTGSKKLAKITPYSRDGVQVEMVFNHHVVWGTKPEWVVPDGWRAEGVQRLLEDLLLHLCIVQKGYELDGTIKRDQLERGFKGYGPAFTRGANSIAYRLGLPQVTFRHRSLDEAQLATLNKRQREERGEELNRPLASAWPHCVRTDPADDSKPLHERQISPQKYYLGHVTNDLLRLLGCLPPEVVQTDPPIPGPTAWELIESVLTFGPDDPAEEIARRAGIIRRLARRQIRFHQARSALKARLGGPVIERFEKGLEDDNGAPITKRVPFEPSWLTWEGGIVGMMAESILAQETWADLPVLADALEEAAACCPGGHSETDYILRHLRACNKGHGRSCWVIAGLLDTRRQVGQAGQIQDAGNTPYQEIDPC